MLRHTFVTTRLDAGSTCATSRSPPDMPTPHDGALRARNNLDRHVNYILAAFMASAT
jgi:hypothetical protein